MFIVYRRIVKILFRPARPWHLSLTWSEISINYSETVFEYGLWSWLCMCPPPPVRPAPASYGTINPLTPLHVQLSVFTLPSNSDDLGLHIGVVWIASLCFACAWIYRCRRPWARWRERETDGVGVNVCASVGGVCVCVCVCASVWVCACSRTCVLYMCVSAVTR